MNLDIERIKTLIDYDILDSCPEEMFDEITSMASIISKMPISLISLLDTERQFFKSTHGVNIRETPIEYSFCNIAIKETNDIFIVEDARKDYRFCNNPFVIKEPFVVSYYGVPLKSLEGVAYGTLCVIDSDLKILNDEQKIILKKLAKQVEHLIEHRRNSRLLNDYKSKIEVYGKNMEEFAYLAAHDLKAPIRAIDSFAKLLDKKNEKIWDKKDAKYLHFIKEGTSKMNHLILDLMEYSKANFEKNTIETFNLNNLIIEIFKDLSLGITKNKPKIFVDKIPNIHSYKTAFTILFKNLIENAIKYQKQDSIPIVKIKYHETFNDMTFFVEDNGIGIGKEYLELIFKPFKRLHSDAEYQGNGLGLAACSKIIQSLNGSIKAESTEGKGSTFIVKIPK